MHRCVSSNHSLTSNSRPSNIKNTDALCVSGRQITKQVSFDVSEVLRSTQCGCALQIADVTIPELEMVKVAQMVSIGCEIAQACKAAYSNPCTRRQMNLETRFTLASTTRFLTTDFIQAGPTPPQTARLSSCQPIFHPGMAVLGEQLADCTACKGLIRPAPSAISTAASAMFIRNVAAPALECLVY